MAAEIRVEFRVFEQDAGWGEWAGDAPFYGTDPVHDWLEKERTDLECPDCSHGFSLGATDDRGDPGPSGICMVRHSRGLVCVEYRPKGRP